MRHCRMSQADIQPASEGEDYEQVKQVQRKGNFAQKRHRPALESVVELGRKCHSSNNQNSWQYGPARYEIVAETSMSIRPLSQYSPQNQSSDKRSCRPNQR